MNLSRKLSRIKRLTKDETKEQVNRLRELSDLAIQLNTAIRTLRTTLSQVAPLTENGRIELSSAIFNCQMALAGMKIVNQNNRDLEMTLNLVRVARESLIRHAKKPKDS